MATVNVSDFLKKKEERSREILSKREKIEYDIAPDTWSSMLNGVRNNVANTYLGITQGSQLVNENRLADIMIDAPTALEQAMDAPTWFTKGAYEDKEQKNKLLKTVGGTLTDIGQNLAAGILGMGETSVDAFATGSALLTQNQRNNSRFGGAFAGEEGEAYFDKLAGEQKENATAFVEKDLYDEKKIAKGIIAGSTENSIFGDKADQLIQSGGQMLATAGLSMAGVPWFLTTAATSFGGEAEAALKNGATLEQAATSAAISAGAEILTEKLGGISFGGATLDDQIVKRLAQAVSNKFVRNALAVGVKGAGEGVEEWISNAVSEFGQSLTYADPTTVKELLFDEAALDAAIGGFLMGGTSASFNAAKSKFNGVDYASGMTANEQKVIDKVYKDRLAEEAKNGKVTTHRKNRIYDAVLREMERGGISTDTIGEVLGGNTYKTYKDTVAKEDAIRKEYQPLYEMKTGDKSDAQIDRQAELKKQLDEISGKRSKLYSSLTDLVKNDRLSESYNERARRGQAFTADVSKYDAKQQETIQKAIDSGILNNTNRTHEFVDLIARISADKGVPFDFTNNERIKESGFAVEGASVNGYVTKDGVTLNVDSAKSLNSVVGHEITHVLEGTELYDTLQSAIKNYAISKMGLDGFNAKLKEMEKLYKGIGDPDMELTADLIGDYLFTDADFVRNLSANNRNVFEKIFDEIKYLCKVATAGSKEARELEKVKKIFEDAYRSTEAELKDRDVVKSRAGEKAVSANAPVNEAYGAVENILSMDRINNTTANEIINNAEIAQAFTDITGVELTGTTEQKRQLIRDTVREWQNRTAENETLAMEAGEQTAAAFEKEQAEQAVRDSGYRSYIIGMLTPNGTTTANAQEILRSPELKAEWEAVTGKKLPQNYKSALKMIQQTKRNPVKLNESFAQQYLDTKKVQYNLSAVESHQKSLELKYSKDAAIDLETVMGRYGKILEIWDRVGGELDSKFLNEWNSKVKKDRAFTVFKKQTGYKYNVELSSMCKKGVPLFEAIDTIVKQEVMKDLQTDVLGKAEKEILYDILKQHSFEIPCAICYVEQARQREGNVINAFLNGRVDTDPNGKTTNVKLGWNQVLDSIEAEMRANGVDYTFPGVSRDIATDKYTPEDISMDEATQDAFYAATLKVLNNEILRYNEASKKNRKLLTDISPKSIKENLKGALPDNLKIFKVLLTEPSSRFRIQSDLLYSSLTTQNLSTAHNDLYTVFNAQGGVSGYKTKQGTAIYWGDILGKKWTSSATRKEGGIRNQSNSDFQMYTLLDQAQMYMDFTAKGYYLQAYTKVLSELKLFGMSNGKINASLIPRVIEYKNADGSVDIERTMNNAGLDENGEPIYDDIEGINHAEAFMLIDDTEYSKSVGGICIGYSDNHIQKLLDDKRVQLIIGFHDNTNDPNKRYRGARYATNYTGRNEATSKKTGETVHMNFNPYVAKAEKQFKRSGETFTGEAEFNGKTYVADDIPKLAADMYLADCEAKGLNPAYMGFETHPNYYKLLADFSLYDSQGHYAPHRKVTYNMPDKVPYLDEYGSKRYMDTDKYIKKELEKELRVRDSIAEALADNSPEGIIPQFKQRVNELHNASRSLSGIGDDIAPTGNYNVYGSDVALSQEDLAPVGGETVAKNATVAPETKTGSAPVAGSKKEPATGAVKEQVAKKIANFQTELDNNIRMRDQSNADFDAEITRLQAEYNALSDKNTAKANDLLRRIERRQRMKSNVEADYQKRIDNLEKRIEKMSKPEYRIAMQRQAKQQEYAALMEKLVGDTTSWVDKKWGLGYEVNTLKRNLRDVVRNEDGSRNIKKADAIYNELQGKYNHNEARLKTESNRIKKPYADLKITKAEDAYIQMLGELRHNPDTTLTEETVNEFYEKNKNSIDTAKVDKVIEDARKTYDELLIRVNEVLREQGMKEIPYRKGYFPHFTDDKQSFLGKLLNWKTKSGNIPTDIAGLTENFNPNRSWQSFNKQRKTDITDYSFMKGMDSYVQGSLDWIYHIDDIQKRRAFENYIRYVHSEQGVQDKIKAIKKNEEYDAEEMQKQIDLVYGEAENPLNNFVTDLRTGTNTLAGKKSSMDRGAEQKTNREFYSTMTNISNRVSANMVAGSISSALTNFIPITQSWGVVSPVSSLRAMGDTIRATIRDDGMVSKSDFLTNRLVQTENLYQTGWDKVSDKVGMLMDAIDNFTSQTVWRSKYIENMSNGMSETEAIKNADEFAEGVMAGRSRGNQPTIFDSKSPITKVFTAFQLEVANQYGYFLKDMPQEMQNDTKAKLAMGYAKAFIGAYVYNALYSKLTGRDAAFDPIRIVQELLGDLGFGGDDEAEEIAPVDAIWNFTENVLEQVPFVGGLIGGGRVPISSALPYDGNLQEIYRGIDKMVTDKDFSDLTTEWLNPVYYLAMPMAGGQIRKSIQGLSMFSDDHPVAGSYTTSGKLRYAVEDTVGNRIKAAVFGQYASQNARQYFDEGRTALADKQIREFQALGVPIQDYWAYQDDAKNIAKRAEIEGAADDDILKDKYINSVNSELSDILREQSEVMDNPDLTDAEKEKRISDLQKRFDALSKERYSSYNTVTYDTKYREGGKYATVGDRIFKFDEKKGEWNKLDDDAVTKYKVTKAAGNAMYADDGKNYYRWYKPEGKAARWEKLDKDQVTKYLTIRDVDKNAHYATNGKIHYRLEEGGEPKNISDWTKISDKELARQKEVTAELGITPEEYWSKTEKTVFPMYEGEYEYAFDNPENYAVAKAVGGYDAFKGYSNDLSDIKSDKDANGKSISGSRKAKVLNYINSLDADYYTKLILWKSEYPSDDSHNVEIIEYLNSRNDLSYSDIESILKELDFKVSADGRISW